MPKRPDNLWMRATRVLWENFGVL
jgi:hypothetical protein